VIEMPPRYLSAKQGEALMLATLRGSL